MEYEQETKKINDWHIRTRKPRQEGPHPLVVMLHGWTGDEDAMWVFASRMPKDAYLVSPRGPYKTPLGGYGWHEHKSKVWPWVDDFRTTIDGLLDLMQPENFPEVDLEQFHLVGFSQGAACGYALSLQNPRTVGRIAGLSGFMPQGADALARNRPLADRQVFIAHGTQDELVPVEKARKAVEILEEAGASVIYCEDDVGHKLSASCFNGLQNFFSQSEQA